MYNNEIDMSILSIEIILHLDFSVCLAFTFQSKVGLSVFTASYLLFRCEPLA